MKAKLTITKAAIAVCLGLPCIASGAAEPCDVRQSLERAAVQLNAGRGEAALAALACVVDAEPDNPWLWYYTAAAHFQLGDTYESLADLSRSDSALTRVEAEDAGLATKIRKLRRRAQRSVFQVSLRLGMSYDTNVSYLDDAALSEDIIAGEEDGFFESRLAVAFSPLKTRIHTFTVGAEVTNTSHFRVDEFDIMSTGGFARYTVRLSGASEVSLQYDWDIVDLDYSAYLTRNAVSLAWRQEWTPVAKSLRFVDTVWAYAVEDQDFHYRVASDFYQDGLVQSVGVVQRFEWRPNATIPWSCTGRIGYTFRDFDTDGREYERRSHRTTADLECPLLNPSQWNDYLIIADKPLWLTLVFDWEDTRYSQSASAERSTHKRRDRTTMYGLTLSQVLSQDEEQDLIVHFLARWTDADSNVRTSSGATPFTFDKFVVGLQFEWSW